jgi:predicted metalloprotease with PDZ domain
MAFCRCENPENMSMQEFKTLLWADDSMTTYIDDRKNRRAGTMPQSTYKHLWTRIKPGRERERAQERESAQEREREREREREY